jgi:UDP-N-acetyl-D-glucosamine dehydrogenase
LSDRDRAAAPALDVAGLRGRFRARKATVGVIGLGYVGLPLLEAVVEAGFCGLGLDVDPVKVETLQAGRSHIRHIADEQIARLRATARFEATTDLARIAGLDAILICVPTPLTRHRRRISASSSGPPRRSRAICGPASSWCSNRRPIRAPRPRS